MVETFNVVIDSTTKQVKRHGYTDFANDGVYDSSTETILTAVNFYFDPPAHIKLVTDLVNPYWYWNSASGTFQETAP